MPRIILSIWGGSGCGKSTLAKALAVRLGDARASRVPCDYFLKPNPYATLAPYALTPLAYDWDLIETCLTGVDGAERSAPSFDFNGFKRVAISGGPGFTLRPVMILDAMLPYPRADVIIRVYLPEDLRRQRIIARDAIWGTRVIDYWQHHQRTLTFAERIALPACLELDGREPVEHNLERILAALRLSP